MSHGDHISARATRRLRLGGRVQGVGFRPFVSRSAHQFGITGSVCNRGGEVEIITRASPRSWNAFSTTC